MQRLMICTLQAGGHVNGATLKEGHTDSPVNNSNNGIEEESPEDKEVSVRMTRESARQDEDSGQTFREQTQRCPLLSTSPKTCDL